MDLLIKGSPIPQNCHQCDSWGLSDVVTIDCPVDKNGSLYSFTDRPKGCPLIPVPEHGRLIDAEEFKTHFWEKQAYFTERIYQKLDMMPTIIPADKEGDNG